MKDDLIKLTCPNCGATLKWKNFEIEIKCDYCGTSVVLEKCINDTRINRADKFKVYSKLAKSALSDNNFLRAFYYFDRASLIYPSDKILVLRNITNYLCDNVDFNYSWFEAMECLNEQDRLSILIKIRNKAVKERKFIYKSIPHSGAGVFYNIYLFLKVTFIYHKLLKRVKKEMKEVSSSEKGE